jgi:hypothetical protein
MVGKWVFMFLNQVKVVKVKQCMSYLNLYFVNFLAFFNSNPIPN